jgi:uncharacterized protein (TIGR03437 family)
MPQKQLRVITPFLICASAAFAQVTLNPVPTRAVGHARQLPGFGFDTSSPNLVEGREMFLPSGIALDTSVTPPILYVSDTQNNRILAWQNALSFSNGKTADRVFGQLNPYSTSAFGPGTPRTTGMSRPTGLAVLNGDLYVVDGGNNRILRFRKPFNLPTDQQPVPDLIIGQANINGRNPNAPNGLSTNNVSLTGAIAFDRTNNLWFTDALNNRVLRFPASAISGNNVNFPDADMELGQLDYTSVQTTLVPATDAGRRIKNQLNVPTALAFDSAQRLYVADYNPNNSFGTTRVLVFEPPFTPGKSASRIMGVFPQQQQGGPAPSQQSIFSVAMADVQAIFFLPGTQGIGIMDGGFSRIMLFDRYEDWPSQDNSFSPTAKAIIGHATGLAGTTSLDTKSLFANDGNPQSASTTFFQPQSAVLLNNELFVADTYNNRVIVLPLQNGTFAPASRLLGQDRYDSNAPNLIEGREFQFINLAGGANAGIALDTAGDVPRLYVADTYNHRILGFKDVRKLKAGIAADIVIGQPDMSTAICNYPTGDVTKATQTSVCFPIGLLVDKDGNLYVADSGNGRVIRFPTPFSHAGNQVADVVLGQADFSSRITDASNRNMGAPFGLAFAGTNGLLVSDADLNRVLYFPFTNGTFTGADNGKAATKVFGQTDFNSSSRGAADSGMFSPRHLSSDTDGRPYVVDAGNNRVLIFDQINNTPTAGAHAAFIIPGLNSPNGINVNPNTGEIWVTETNSQQIRRFPKFDTIIFRLTSDTLPALAPLAVIQDQYGDLIVAEATNRVSFYFPGLAGVNLANSIANRALAPNTIGSLYALAGGSFGKESAANTSLPNPVPLPKVLADVQVLVNDVPAPLYFVGSGQINFVVPWSTDTGSPAAIQVIKVSTGQVLAAGAVAMNSVSPGIIETSNAGTNRQAAVINIKDGTVNSPTNPVARGDYISIYATGQGMVSNPPADGDVPRELTSTPSLPRVFIGSCFVTDCRPSTGEVYPAQPVQFSGLSPQYPGVWQINVYIPQITDVTAANVVFVQANSVISGGLNLNGFNTVIYVK